MGLKVLNVVEDGRFGGPHRRIIEVARRLRDEGIETTVLCPRDGSEAFQRQLRTNAVRFRPVRMHGLRRSLPAVLRYALWLLPETGSVVRTIRRGGFPIVHCNGSWQWKGVLAGRLAGAKTVWHLNDTRDERWLRLTFRMLSRLTCDAYIVASRRILSGLPARIREQGPVAEIQAPVDTRFFDPAGVPPDPTLQGNREAGGVNIVTVGNINPAKGLEHFMEMASILNARHGGLRYYVVGNWFRERQAYYEALVRLGDRVGVGNLSFVHGVTDVRPHLAAADLYVCPSIHEASPISVWEAMSMGKAIVSSDVGDVRRFIRDGENGLVVPVEDAAALAAGVERLLRDERLRACLGARARETAIRELDLGICARKHRELYEILARGRGKG